MKNNIAENKGLTLVELLAVIVVLGIITAIAVPSISSILENTKIKAEKNNAILLIQAADLYFIEHYDRTGYIQSVSIPTLMSLGFIEDENLANDTVWIAEAKPSWICGKAETSKNQVEFRKATVEMINNSGRDTKVGKEACGDMPAIP
ncbi:MULTISPECIES: Tfp pilus assembly protein FimT/FimU [unclassified Sporosarcina]|uniref:pilus assembly FimT family protein n=1 Tax=unclassified Sporosarcina TaxID=2647733 RepID=UPI000C1687CA|nr:MULTISPECIES: type II secretion system protein [unclassified Sporosarcina]PID07339.1 hypothetical protein CSV66_01820 [Sporosarcina sp. P30]PID10535.1 hypothetical protein CSV65_01825 [Sporosarcina sp. P31]PID13120.1 hypothetical protein CSV64_04405 [Sporosarcina sp. P32b]